SRVLELHGSGRTVECLDCGRREPRSAVQERLDTEMPPRCPHCGGTVLRPTVVLFGEPMPAAPMQEAFALAAEADVMLVVGSSLVVYPAADVPFVALRSGARMIVINAEPTPFDRLAEVVIHGRSGEVLPQIAFCGVVSTRMPPTLRLSSRRSLGHLRRMPTPHASEAAMPAARLSSGLGWRTKDTRSAAPGGASQRRSIRPRPAVWWSAMTIEPIGSSRATSCVEVTESRRKT